MKLTIEPTEGNSDKVDCMMPTVTISLPADDPDGLDFVAYLVRPLMLALGYQPKTIAHAFRVNGGAEPPGQEVKFAGAD